MEAVVKGHKRAGAVPPPDDLVELARGLLGEPDVVRAELDRINGHVELFYDMEPDQAMRAVAAYSARVTEIVRLLFRVERTERMYTRLRTMEAQPLLDELKFQFQVHSRLLESRRQDMLVEGIR